MARGACSDPIHRALIYTFNDVISGWGFDGATDFSWFDFLYGLFKFGQERAGEESAEVAALSPRCCVGGIELCECFKFCA